MPKFTYYRMCTFVNACLQLKRNGRGCLHRRSLNYYQRFSVIMYTECIFYVNRVHKKHTLYLSPIRKFVYPLNNKWCYWDKKRHVDSVGYRKEKFESLHLIIKTFGFRFYKLNLIICKKTKKNFTKNKTNFTKNNKCEWCLLYKNSTSWFMYLYGNI